MATVENLMLSTTYLRFPTGQLPTPSDTKGKLFAPDEELFAERSRRALETRVTALLEAERRRYTDLLDGLGITAETPEQLRAASRRVDDLRFAAVQRGPERHS